MYEQDAAGAYQTIVDAVGGSPNIVLLDRSPVVVDEATDSQSGGAPTRVPWYAVITTNARLYSNTAAPDGVFKARRKLLVPGYTLSVVPIPFQTEVEFDGYTWNIYEVVPVAPAGETTDAVILYTILVQR